MTLSNRDLVRRFAEGGTSGKACNMDIRERAGYTFLVGYDWAVYAHRTPGGTVVLHDGWYGYSVTTSTHLNLIRAHADVVRDESQLQWSSVPTELPEGVNLYA